MYFHRGVICLVKKPRSTLVARLVYHNVSKELQDALRYLEKPIIKEDSLQLSKMIEAQFRKAMSDQKWRQDVKAMEIRYQELLQEGRIEGRAEGRNDREMEIVLGMIEEGASDEMILKYLKISKERLEQIKKIKKYTYKNILNKEKI